MDQFGRFYLGATIYLPWSTFASAGSSVTYSDLTVKIFKTNDLTQRASSNGVTLTLDHDGDTGTHLIAIDTSDNSDAGFYSSATDFLIKCSATVDGKSVTLWAVTFSLIQQIAASDTLQPLLAEDGSIVVAITASDVLVLRGDQTAGPPPPFLLSSSDTLAPAISDVSSVYDVPTIPLSASDVLIPILAEYCYFGWAPGPPVEILTLPDTKFAHSRFILHGNDSELISPLTRSVQTIELLGSRWMATYELPPMTRENAEQWVAFLCALGGSSGRFYGFDPPKITPRGSGLGSPSINGAGQAGTSLATAGWTANAPLVLRAGDYVSFVTASGWRELHLVTSDASADANGEAVLQITPPLREYPLDGGTLVLTYASCPMRLTDDATDWDVDYVSTYGLVFSGEEAFLTRDRG